MPTMRLAIITMRNFSCCDLYGATKKQIIDNNLSISLQKIYIEDIIISYSQNKIQLTTIKNNLLNDFDAFLFRVDLQKNLDKFYFVSHTLKYKKKILVNEIFSQNTTFSDKLSMLTIAQELNINHPKTTYIDSLNLFIQETKSLKFPYIVKDTHGWQGQSVYLIKKVSDLNSIQTNFPQNGLVIQEYLPTDYDIRVITIGKTAIAAMKRTNPKNDFRSNLSLGGKAQNITLTKEMKIISEKIARHIQSAMLGVDFIAYKDTLYVIEVETCPGFSGFAKTTKTNPLLKLLQYMYTQHVQN